MNYGIIGPRDFNGVVYSNTSYIDTVLKYYQPNISKIISGGGKGVESLVKTWAYDNKVECQIVLPNIQLYGEKEAFIFRNQNILKEADILILFWDSHNISAIKPIAEAIRGNKCVHVIPMI